MLLEKDEKGILESKGKLQQMNVFPFFGKKKADLLLFLEKSEYVRTSKHHVLKFASLSRWRLGEVIRLPNGPVT